MLVLSRTKDEVITIGDDITVRIVDVRGNRVRIGITAPPDVDVWRTELLENPPTETLRTCRCCKQRQTREIPSVHFSGVEPLEH